MYILFGEGDFGRLTVELIGKEKVTYFCDNSERQPYKGVRVISFEELKELHKKI